MKVFKEKYPLSVKSLTFKKDCFYDSQYHLNHKGMEKRTDIILGLLKAKINFLIEDKRKIYEKNFKKNSTKYCCDVYL